MLLQDYTDQELIREAELSDDPLTRELAHRLAKTFPSPFDTKISQLEILTLSEIPVYCTLLRR